METDLVALGELLEAVQEHPGIALHLTLTPLVTEESCPLYVSQAKAWGLGLDGEVVLQGLEQGTIFHDNARRRALPSRQKSTRQQYSQQRENMRARALDRLGSGQGPPPVGPPLPSVAWSASLEDVLVAGRIRLNRDRLLFTFLQGAPLELQLPRYQETSYATKRHARSTLLVLVERAPLS